MKKSTKKSWKNWKHSDIFAPSTALPRLQRVAAELKKMTPEEFRESLVEAGIIDKNGKLTAPYRPPPRKKKK
jgi:hypothetical protein